MGHVLVSEAKVKLHAAPSENPTKVVLGLDFDELCGPKHSEAR